MTKRMRIAWFTLVLSLAMSVNGFAKPVPSTVGKSANGPYHLLRAGKPVVIKGVEGETQLDKLKQAGGNVSGAKSLTFWARGAQGGELVSFVVADQVLPPRRSLPEASNLHGNCSRSARRATCP